MTQFARRSATRRLRRARRDAAGDGMIPARLDRRQRALRSGDPVATGEGGARRVATCSMWRCGDQLAAVRCAHRSTSARSPTASLTLDELHAGTGAIGNVDGWWLDEVWDFIRLLARTADARHRADRRARSACPSRRRRRTRRSSATIPSSFSAAPGSERESSSSRTWCSTRSAGPILVSAGSARSRLHAHQRPVLHRPRRQRPGRRRSTACSIGDVCKVRGELSTTIFLGHSNKGHDGFVGHSYLGRWVNLGAGTITSNLKNTYGTVALWTPDRRSRHRTCSSSARCSAIT